MIRVILVDEKTDKQEGNGSAIRFLFLCCFNLGIRSSNETTLFSDHITSTIELSLSSKSLNVKHLSNIRFFA